MVRLKVFISTSFFVFLFALAMSQEKAFDEYALPKTYLKQTNYTDVTAPTSSDVQVILDTKSPKHPVRTSLFGQNAVAWQGDVKPTTNQYLNYKNAHYSFLRYPGGNWSNIFFWDGQLPAQIKTDAVVQGPSSLKAGNTAWMLETDEFPGLLTHTGADGIVCVNVGWAFYGTDADPVGTAAQYAADWVHHYRNTLGLDVKYWELGNENYGPWQAGYSFANPQKYANACVAFYQAMKAVDSSIKIGVVLYEGAGGFNSDPNTKDWNELILPIVKDHMDYIIIHQYPHPASNRNNISESEIYSARSSINEVVETIENQVVTYTGKAKDHFPICITEYNARAGTRELSRTNALFTSLFLGEMAEHNIGGAMQWSLSNGYDDEGGAHGAVADQDPFMTDGDPNAGWYPHYFMDKYFGDTLISASSSDSNIVVYGTTFSSGEVGAMVVNVGSESKNVALDLNGGAVGARYYWHQVNGDVSDFDRTIYINDQGPSNSFFVGTQYCNAGNCATAGAFEANGVGGPNNYSSILPYSTIGNSGSALFKVPPHTVMYMVFETLGDHCAVPDLGQNVILCSSTSHTLNSGLSAQGKTFEWLDSNNNLVGEQSALVIQKPGTYTLWVDSNGCRVSDQVSISSFLPEVSNDTVCAPGTVQLHIDGEGDFEWYSDSGQLNSFHVGNSYSPFIYQSEVYYVGNPTVVKHALGKSIQDGVIKTFSDYSSSWKKTEVSVSQALDLEALSVFVNTNSSTVKLNLYKANGSVVFTQSYGGLSAGKQRLTIGVLLEKDSSYVLDLQGSDVHVVDWQDENQDSSVLAGYLSFQNLQSWASDKYGFFYDWEMSQSAQICSRIPIYAVLDASAAQCQVTGVAADELAFDEIKVYPNPFSETIVISLPESFAHFEVALMNLVGQVIMQKKVAGNQLSWFVGDLLPGSYLIQVKYHGQAVRKKIVKSN